MIGYYSDERLLASHIIQLYSVIFHNSMYKQAEHQVKRRISLTGPNANIEKLCLDNIPINKITHNIKRMIQTCTNLKYLTINHCSLTSLQNFPSLKTLFCLELQDNMLTDDDLTHLIHISSLSFISIENNLISSTKALHHLNSLAQLQILQLKGNPLCDEENYRQTIFQILPNIKVINHHDHLGNQIQLQNESEYISSIGSRRDLLQGLDEFPVFEQDNKLVQAQMKKTTDQYSDEIDIPQPSVNFKRLTNTSLLHLFQQPYYLPDKPQLQKQETIHSKDECQQQICSGTRKYVKQ